MGGGRRGGETIVSKNEFEKVNKMVKVIWKHESINVWDMIDEARVSIRDYYNLKGYMEHKFKNGIKYEETTKNWVVIVQKKELKDLV